MLLRRALLASLLVAGVSAGPAAPTVEPARQAPRPDTPRPQLQGLLRYKVRGPTAIQGGFLSSFLGGTVGGALLMERLTNALRIFAGAKGLSNNPGSKEVNDFLRQGSKIPIDVASLPFYASLDVDLVFTLEPDDKGNYHLVSGTAKWTAGTKADVRIADGDNVQHFIDNYAGDGTAVLDTSTSSITITAGERPAGKNQRRPYTLDVNVGFPMVVNGNSMWSALSGHAVMRVQDRGGTRQYTMQMLGMGGTEPPEPITPHGGFAVYTRTAPLGDLLSGRETYQDLMDSGVFVEYELYPSCEAEILAPEPDEMLVFDELSPGRIDRDARARVLPNLWRDFVEWELPYLEGTRSEPDPVDMVGDSLPYLYERLPPKNSTLGDRFFRAKLASGPASRGNCKSPEPQHVRFLFPREARNSASGPYVPNWFHYWTQTKAAQGHASVVEYGGNGPSCEPKDRGYYKLGQEFIFVCDLSQDDFKKYNTVAGISFEGIDEFASVVLHEWTHKVHYNQWWKPRGGYKPELDADSDRIPDSMEADSLEHVFDPLDWDTWNSGYSDEHVLVYLAEEAWAKGSADREDWACPGRQSGNKCPTSGGR